MPRYAFTDHPMYRSPDDLRLQHDLLGHNLASMATCPACQQTSGGGVVVKCLDCANKFHITTAGYGCMPPICDVTQQPHRLVYLALLVPDKHQQVRHLMQHMLGTNATLTAIDYRALRQILDNPASISYQLPASAIATQHRQPRVKVAVKNGAARNKIE